MQYRTDSVSILWAAILLTLLAKTADSQKIDPYFFRHLTQEDGLIHNDVLSIAQDKKGFIWIATSNGLQRYEGNRFLNLRDLLNDPFTSYSGAVTMCEDGKDNSLWINKESITEKVDLATNRITYYKNKELLQLPSLPYISYAQTSHSTWYVTEKAVFIHDITTNNLALYFKKGGSTNHTSGTFSADPATGETWIGGSVTGLRLLDKHTKRIYTADDNPIQHPLLQALHASFGTKQPAIREVMQDSHNRLWVSTWGKLFFKYDPSNRRLTRYSLSKVNATVSSLFEDNHQALWVCTEYAGLLRYDEAADRFDAVLADDNDKISTLFDFHFNCIFQDRDENIWLGSDKGITIFNPYRQYFRYIHHEEGNNASLPKNEIQCTIQTRSGDILASTWGGGITVYDSNWHFKRNITLHGQLEYNLVWDFIQNDDGRIWAGCQHGYIHIYDPLTGSLKTIHPPEMDHSTIRCMAKDHAGNIWFGLHNGKMVEWARKEKKFYRYNDTISAKIQTYPFIVSIFFDSKQRCWVSTDRGLRQFDLVTRRYISEYLPDHSKPDGIKANTPKGIEEWNDTTLLIGTLYGGLNSFNPENGRFKQLFFGDSLLYNNIYAVKKDAAGYCWFTTDYGLFRFKPGGKTITRFNIGNETINSSFKSLRFDTLQNGDWATFTATGIVIFRPGIPQKQEFAKVEITGCKIFDATVPSDSLPADGNILRLEHNKNFITIEFARLRFNDLHQNTYYYRLKGVNDEWLHAGTLPFATYTNLSPGTYQFEVKADDGEHMTPPTSLKIVITPPFWKTWWFFCLVGACAVFFLYRMVRWRLEVLSINEKLSLARLEALQSQMNPHFIFNCLSSIDNLIQTGEKGKATTYLAKFARLIRSILETSKANTIPCWMDLETLALYLEMEALRCDMKFSYTLDIDEKITSGDYRVPPLVIQPFVENAIHHGLLNKREKKKDLLITVTVTKEFIRYIIEDNGVGRKQAMEYRRLNKPSHQSMGLQISTDRINLFNQNEGTAVIITDLFNDAGEAAGTRVQVNIINQP